MFCPKEMGVLKNVEQGDEMPNPYFRIITTRKYCTEPQENMYEDIYDSFVISGSSLSISKGILCNISDELDISVAT